MLIAELPLTADIGSILDIDGVGFGAAATRINRTALSDTFVDA